MKNIYFDNAATTKPYEEAARLSYEISLNQYGNPSSLHNFGMASQEIVENAREHIATKLHCDKKEIYFTSGGTEGNNLAIIGAANALKRRGKRIITTAVEHPSVLNVFKYLEAEGFEAIYIEPQEDGKIHLEDIIKSINEQTILVSVMLVNNETGEILPVKGIKAHLKRVSPFALLHCDGVQGYGKLNVNVKDLGVDLLTISGHKVHSPKGVGALYMKNDVHIKPVLFGGGQEKGIRSGTENVSAIAAFGKASEIKNKALYEDNEKIAALKEYLLLKLRENIQGVKINSPVDGVPHITNLSLVGFRSEIMLHFLESKGIFISSGSACSSKKNSASHVLTAMGCSRGITDSALRVSLCYENTKEEIDVFVAALGEGVRTLMRGKG